MPISWMSKQRLDGNQAHVEEETDREPAFSCLQTQLAIRAARPRTRVCIWRQHERRGRRAGCQPDVHRLRTAPADATCASNTRGLGPDKARRPDTHHSTDGV